MKTLFVPVDLSNHSNKALDYAISLGMAVAAKKLVVFHHNPPIYTGEIPVLYTDDLERIHLEIKAHLEKDLAKRLKKEGAEKMKTQVIVTQDAGAVYSIVNHARETGADLIIMGSHGKTGLENLVFGSVTTGVIETSSIPVLAIPQRFTFQPVKVISFASTLAHIGKELSLVQPFLKSLKASLEIVNLQYPWDPKDAENHARGVLQHKEYQGVSLEVIKASIEKSMAEQIQSRMKKTKPDWVVMFPRKLSWFSKIFISSTSLHVLHHSRKPMLLIHRAED